MADRPTLNIRDLPPELRKQLGLQAPRRPRSMTKDEIRTAAIRVMHVMADLTPAERRRVIAQAAKLNEV